jgi:hypothetical protein
MEMIMRKFVTPLLVALVAVAPGAAFAAGTAAAPAAKPAVTAPMDQSTSGTVKAFDGKIYQLPTTFKDPGLKAGEKVTVHWKMNGTAYDATSVIIG